jgi:hypothetical protein
MAQEFEVHERGTATARTACLLAGRRLKERGAGVLPVRQPNYSKIDNCYCPRHQPQIEKTANSIRGKNAKSTLLAKQSKHSFLKGGVTRMKEVEACEVLSDVSCAVLSSGCIFTRFLLAFFQLCPIQSAPS